MHRYYLINRWNSGSPDGDGDGTVLHGGGVLVGKQQEGSSGARGVDSSKGGERHGGYRYPAAASATAAAAAAAGGEGARVRALGVRSAGVLASLALPSYSSYSSSSFPASASASAAALSSSGTSSVRGDSTTAGNEAAIAVLDQRCISLYSKLGVGGRGACGEKENLPVPWALLSASEYNPNTGN
jgi:hypothetical protein